MTTSFIRKNLVKPILHSGIQNAMNFLNQNVKPQSRMDGQLFTEVVSNLKHTAAHNGLISLSAPQIKYKNRIFVILKKSLINYSKWTGYQDLFLSKKPQDCYDAIINPQIVSYSNFKIKGDEECPSVDGLKFKVWIPLTNVMNFVKYTQKLQKSKVKPVFEHCEQQFTGFYGRVFDHEYRHLEGMLVSIPQVCNNEIYLTDESKENPQNFIQLQNHRIEREFFDEQNLEKQLKKEEQMIRKQSQLKQKQKRGPKLSQTISPDKLPDKIDSKLKQQLMKSYEKAKGTQKISFSKLKPQQNLGKIKQGKKKDTKNEKNQNFHRPKSNSKK